MAFDLDASPGLLERTPATLRALLAGLPREWLERDEGPGTWSPLVVLGHLVHGEETDWIPRARILLGQGESRPFDPFDRHAQLRRFRDHSPAELLERFERRRAESLGALRGLALTPDDLARTGIHPELGRVTLGELLATWVVHDLGHIAQIARVLAKGHGGEVGPWRAYLPVLGR